MLHKRFEADTTELRVGVVVTSPTYNTQLESSKGFWSVPLHLHARPTPHPNIPVYLCFHKSFIHQIPEHAEWDMNGCQSHRMENLVTTMRREALKTHQQGFPLTHEQQSATCSGPASRNHPEFWKSLGNPGLSLSCLSQQVALFGCVRAEHRLSIWSAGACVAGSPSGETETT